jgi:hypothetical protein
MVPCKFQRSAAPGKLELRGYTALESFPLLPFGPPSPNQGPNGTRAAHITRARSSLASRLDEMRWPHALGLPLLSNVPTRLEENAASRRLPIFSGQVTFCRSPTTIPGEWVDSSACACDLNNGDPRAIIELWRNARASSLLHTVLAYPCKEHIAVAYGELVSYTIQQVCLTRLSSTRGLSCNCIY